VESDITVEFDKASSSRIGPFCSPEEWLDEGIDCCDFPDLVDPLLKKVLAAKGNCEYEAARAECEPVLGNLNGCRGTFGDIGMPGVPGSSAIRWPPALRADPAEP
jgi:phage gp29-like protein